MPCYCAMPQCFNCNPPEQGLYVANMNREASLLFEENKRLKEVIKVMERRIIELKTLNTPVPIQPSKPKWDYSFADEKDQT